MIEPEPVPDWEAIRKAHESGESSTTIAARFGVKAATIRQRAKRQAWINLPKTVTEARRSARTIANRAVTATVESVTRDVTAGIRDELRDYKASISGLTGHALEQLKSHLTSPKDLEDLERVARTLEKLDTVGRRTHGLDDGKASTQVGVRVDIHQLMRPAEPETVIEIGPCGVQSGIQNAIHDHENSGKQGD